MRHTYLTFREILRTSSFQISMVLLFFFLLSLLFFLVQGDRRVERTYFFPESTFGRSYANRRADAATKLFGETRRLPMRKGTEANIRLLVEDMILGPVDPMHVRLLPGRTKLLSLIWRKRALYLNFSGGILSSDAETELSLPLILQGIANTIIFNFPSIRRVFLFIDGEIPDFTDFEGAGPKSFADGLDYDPSILF